MKSRKVIAIVLAVFPLVLLTAWITLEIIFRVGTKIDPYYWREHFISFISAILLVSCPACTLPCIIAARVLNRPVKSRFINTITWIDIFAIVIPLIVFFATCLKK